jgi:hypothetical protein
MALEIPVGLRPRFRHLRVRDRNATVRVADVAAWLRSANLPLIRADAHVADVPFGEALAREVEKRWGGPLPRGGTTVVSLVDENGQEWAHGEARCSRRDNYHRALGRTIALGRALKRYAGTADELPVVRAADVPEFGSVDEATRFWEVHQLAEEDWDTLPEAPALVESNSDALDAMYPEAHLPRTAMNGDTPVSIDGDEFAAGSVSGAAWDALACGEEDLLG